MLRGFGLTPNGLFFSADLLDLDVFRSEAFGLPNPTGMVASVDSTEMVGFLYFHQSAVV